MSCSFCGLSGHFINSCNNERIDALYENIKTTYIQLLSDIQPNELEMLFTTILSLNYTVRDLRAVGFKYLNITGLISHNRRSKLQLINVVWEYFSSRIIAPEIHLNQNSEVEHEITWYIDRTPDIITETNIHYLSYISESLFGQTVARNLTPDFRKNHNIKLFRIEEKHGVSEGVGVSVNDCAICYESVASVDLVKLNCQHEFCNKCIKTQIDSLRPTCAFCRETMKSITVKNDTTYNLLAEYCCPCI